MISNDFRSHFSRPRKRLKRLRKQFLIKQALSMEIINKCQPIIILLIIRIQYAGLFIIQNGRLEISQLEKGLATHSVVIDVFWSEVDGLCERGDSALVELVVYESLAREGTIMEKYEI